MNINMTKNAIFVEGYFLDKELPPIGTQTNYGKIESYNSNFSVNIGNTVLYTETGNTHQDTLYVNNVKLLACNKNKKWIK